MSDGNWFHAAVCENIVRFSRDFYEMILVGKFPSREIGEKCTSRRSQIITQLYPINCNFTGSCLQSLMLRRTAAAGQSITRAGLHEVV